MSCHWSASKLGYNKEKLIISDVDGCLLNWEDHFHNYMHSHGHKKAHKNPSYWQETYYPHLSQDRAREMVYHFNTSAWMLEIPPLRDARTGVAQLVDAGYRFVAVTAMGLDPYAKQVREINLERTFGYDTFIDVIVTDMYDPDSKRKSLESLREQYGSVPWIEDKPSNAQLGQELGYETYLVNHDYNQDFDAGSEIQRVNSWVEICKFILPHS